MPLRHHRPLSTLIRTILVGLSVAVLMTLYELVKQLLAPDIRIWPSHAVTIVVSGLLAGSGAFVVLRRAEETQRQILAAMDQQKAEASAREQTEQALQSSREEYLSIQEALRRRVDELAMLHATSLDIARPYELPRLLETLVARTAGLLEAPAGGLFLCDPERQVLHCVVSYRTKRDYTGVVLRYGEGAAGIAAQTGETLLIDDYRTWSGRAGVFEADQPFTAVLSVPMIWLDEVIGVLDIMDSQEGRRFSQADLDLLMRIADHASLAVANARLTEDEQGQRAQAEALCDTAAALASTLSLQEVLDRILAEVGRVLPHDAANIMLVEDGVASIAAGRGYAPHALDESMLKFRVRVAETSGLREMSTGEPIAIPDTRAFPGWVESPETSWVRSYAAAPIQIKGTLVGYLNLDSAIPGFYNPSHARRLRAFADQAAAAIERARLYEAVRRHAEELEQRVAERTAELAETAAQLQATNATLQMTVEQLKGLDRLKDEFVANVSHELRTPLNNIMLYLELLESGKGEKRDHYLAILQRETQLLRRLIEDLLQLSRLDQGKAQPRLAPVDLNALVAALAGDRRALLAERGLALSIDCTPVLPLVQGDEKMLTQVLTNLMANATNYTPTGGTIRVSTRSRQDHGQTWVELAVADTGPGIAAEEQAHLFERFYRGKAASQSRAPGTGLGLAISNDIVRAHGGRITVESQLGRGSTFAVWLLPADGDGGATDRQSDGR